MGGIFSAYELMQKRNENTNGIVTVNGHSYDSPDLRTENTNFALLVAKHFSAVQIPRALYHRGWQRCHTPPFPCLRIRRACGTAYCGRTKES